MRDVAEGAKVFKELSEFLEKVAILSEKYSGSPDAPEKIMKDLGLKTSGLKKLTPLTPTMADAETEYREQAATRSKELHEAIEKKIGEILNG